MLLAHGSSWGQKRTGLILLTRHRPIQVLQVSSCRLPPLPPRTPYRRGARRPVGGRLHRGENQVAAAGGTVRLLVRRPMGVGNAFLVAFDHHLDQLVPLLLMARANGELGDLLEVCPGAGNLGQPRSSRIIQMLESVADSKSPSAAPARSMARLGVSGVSHFA